MGKPRNEISFTVKGDSGDNVLTLPAGATITNTVIDGGRGNDILDLSGYESAGVSLSLPSGFAKSNSAVTDKPFTGTFATFDFVDETTVRGTIKNIEGVIGTSGNDFLFLNVNGAMPKLVDGGDGNDVVEALGGNATLIGGDGSDWIVSYGQGNTAIGGVNDGDLSTSDGLRDFYYLGSAPTILDFEVGTDQLIFETGMSTVDSYLSPLTAQWVSNGAGGATFMVNNVAEVTLANVDPVTAASITFGFAFLAENGVSEGRSGDDLLFVGVNVADRIKLGSDSGNDLAVSFDASLDILVFEDGVVPTWSNTLVNGAQALVGSFSGGSITLMGLDMDDVAGLNIDGSRGSLAGSTAPVESAWSVESDFPPALLTGPSGDLFF